MQVVSALVQKSSMTRLCASVDSWGGGNIYLNRASNIRIPLSSIEHRICRGICIQQGTDVKETLFLSEHKPNQANEASSRYQRYGSFLFQRGVPEAMRRL